MRNKRLFRHSFQENFIKNIAIIVIVIITYSTLKTSLFEVDESKIGNFLLAISILLVTVSFANFAFSYEYSDLKNTYVRMLAHAATFSFMLLTALLLEVFIISIKLVYPSLFIMTAVLTIILYVGIALYDFWDLLRVFKN